MKFLQSYGPLLLIILAFAWASFAIFTRQKTEVAADTKVIRLAHWQLEASLQDAINELGKDFANDPYVKAKYGKVIIKQEAIPESGYGSWVTANMIAGTAPDLVEIGNALPYNVWLGYLNRYFYPLTSMANEVNPFNKGTDLEKVPFRQTFIDDMRIGYQEELQEYMRVPLSRFTVRVFYNKTLLKKLTGLDTPPSDFRSFLAVCEKIKQQKDADGEYYNPIASSAYHASFWDQGLCQPLSYGFLKDSDYNRDGAVGNDETFAAIKSGRVDMHHPSISAQFNSMIELKNYFQTGFTGLARDEAVFLFAQKKSVFICSGTWEIGILLDQAKDLFEVGVCPFPEPSPDDPKYGKLIVGPTWDPAFVGFGLGVTHFSKDPELAKDFLYYLASKKGNAKLNNIINWIPSVKGVPMPEMMTGFTPLTEGMYGTFNPYLGGVSNTKFSQESAALQTDPHATYDEFVKKVEPIYKGKGLADWNELSLDWRRTIINNDKFLSGLRGMALLESPNNQDDSRWIKYRTYVTNRQVTVGIDRAKQQAMIERGPSRPVAPYDYLPAAKDNIRKQVAAELAHQAKE